MTFKNVQKCANKYLLKCFNIPYISIPNIPQYHFVADLCSKSTTYCESALCSHMWNSFRSMVLDFLIFVTASHEEKQWSNLFVFKVQAQQVKVSYLDISKCIHARFQAKVKVKQETFLRYCIFIYFIDSCVVTMFTLLSDFYSWSYVQTLVYSKKIQNIDNSESTGYELRLNKLPSKSLISVQVEVKFRLVAICDARVDL